MASAGTLLSDLDGKTPVFNKDDDLVNKILADMNVSSNPVITPSGNGRVINSPNPNSTYPMSTDPNTATAHMIGKDYPTAADFANVMYSPQFSGYAPMQQQQPQPTLIEPLKGNIYNDIMSQIKQPLLVAIIIFIISLPVINVLIGHYVPTLLRLGGDLTTVGQVLKALIGGFLFWFIQKILVPLMI
jgi:hypothetical protein